MKKKLNINISGCTPLSAEDAKNVQGGWWQVGAGILIAAGAEIIRDWDNFKAGLMGECEK